MTLNRIAAPDFKQVQHIELIKAQTKVLDNGLKVFVIPAEDQEIIRLEFIFDNINWHSSKPLQAFAANSMLVEGTASLSASKIAERIDFYGAFLQTDYSYDQASVILYTLNKHLEATLPVVKDVITNAVFPQEELDTFIRNQKQKLSVNLEKNDFVSRRVFNHALFGDSLYGYAVEEEDYNNIHRDDLLSYFKSAYQPENCTIVAAGKIDDAVMAALDRNFGKDWESKGRISKNSFKFTTGRGQQHFIERTDALQSAIRIGEVSIGRAHPDFPAVQVLNTVLGGYFGSRLMANIREDKGFTYGIGSALISLKETGYFFIASEVGADVCKAAVDEIQKEINILQSIPVPADELDLVRNYMLGSMLAGLENVFSHADKFKNIYFSGLNYDYYDNYIETVKTITSDELLELANTYLDFDKMEKVIVGKI